jgi:hypothetical protein
VSARPSRVSGWGSELVSFTEFSYSNLLGWMGGQSWSRTLTEEVAEGKAEKGADWGDPPVEGSQAPVPTPAQARVLAW